MNAETIIFVLAVIGWIDLIGGAILSAVTQIFTGSGSVPRE